MSVKIGSIDLSDVFVGTAIGKTNIDKIVVGNADGTGTTVWSRESGPWNSGRWTQDEYEEEAVVWNGTMSRFEGTLYFDESRGEEECTLCFVNGEWNLTDEFSCVETISASREATSLSFETLASTIRWTSD